MPGLAESRGLEEQSLNHLYNIEQTANRYFAMRHGHSLANQQGIIVSHPQNGCGGFGLSDLGHEQVRRSLEADDRLDAATLIVSSDFSRALETAALARSILGCDAEVEIDTRLRERNFGELELGADDAYAEVWRQDELDPDGEFRAVESASRVMARVTAVIADLERRFRNRSLLLVSHGDALQILQTAFARREASAHRQLPHLQTAEIRLLELAESKAG